MRETAAVLAARGASVTVDVFPGLDHVVGDVEVGAAGQLIAAALAAQSHPGQVADRTQ